MPIGPIIGGGILMPKLSAYEGMSFSRASTAVNAYAWDLAVDQPEWSTTAVCGLHDAQQITGEGVGGDNIVPVCTAGQGANRYLYATKYVGLAKSHIYRRQAGQAWTRTNDTVTNIDAVIGLDSGTILLNTSDGAMWRSVDGGATLTQPTLGGEPFSFSANCGFQTNPYHCQAANGTIVVGEWGLNTDALRLYRSVDDGATWAVAHEFADDDCGEGKNRHTHMTVKHEPSGRWLAFRGDGVNDRTAYSDDDGLTWQDLIARGECFWQPMGVWALGDELLLGSDASAQVVAFNPVSRAMRNVIGFIRGSDSSTWFFSLFRDSAGTFYGCNHAGNLLVSPDAKRWAYWWRLAGGEPRIVAEMDGKLHIHVTGTAYQYWQVTPADVHLRTHLRAGPAVTNGLNLQASSFEGGTGGWTATNATVSEDPTAGRYGGSALKVVATADAIIELSSPAVAIVTGAAAQVWARGSGRRYIEGMGGSTVRLVVGAGFGERPITLTDDWRQVIVTKSGTGDGTLMLRIFARAGDTFWIDCAQLYSGMGALWQPGGTPRAADSASWSLSLPQAWTILLRLTPEASSSVQFPPVIASLVTAGGLDCLAWPFVMTLDAGAEELDFGTADILAPQVPVHLAIRLLGTAKVCGTYYTGKSVTHATSESTYAGFRNTTATFRLGDIAGANMIPGRWGPLRFWPEALSDVQLAAAMNEV